jgi:hypothetical protein
VSLDLIGPSRRAAALARPAPPPQLRDELLSIEELRRIEPPAAVLPGRLDANSLAFLIGAPGSHKSRWAIDLALRMTTGTRWPDGSLVAQGPALYVMGEGHLGTPKRVDAWKAVNGVFNDPADLRMIPAPVNLLDRRQVAELVEIVATVRPRMAVIDTLARCTPGADENSAKDMGKAIAALDEIRVAADCLVLVLHHIGKAREAGARGSSALLGAADTMLEITLDGDLITIAPTKQKHHPIGRKDRLRLVSACGDVALVADDGTSNEDVSGKALEALDVLRSIETVEGVSFTIWTDAALDAGISRATLARARSRLLELGLISAETSGSAHPRYVLTDAGRSHLGIAPQNPHLPGKTPPEVSWSQPGLTLVSETRSQGLTTPIGVRP